MPYRAIILGIAFASYSPSLVLAGPDLICSEMNSAATFGFADGKISYAFATTLCNIGDEPVSYSSMSNQHPLISQSLYKLNDGRLSQIGVGFVRHTNVPLAGNMCNLGCTPAGFDALGAGCSDTSSAVINGLQVDMGPRSEVDAQSGFYPFPFTSINQAGDAIYKRLQVEVADISDPSALYFVETQIISSDETTPETRNNNASYRQVIFSPGSSSATLVGPTFAQQAAIFAWRDHGMGIGTPDNGVVIVEAHINGGLYHVASRVESLSPDSYQTTYLIHNQNASSTMDSLSINTDSNAPNAGFSGIVYHDDLDGLIDSQDWITNQDPCDAQITWSAIPNDDDSLVNRVRWGTSYQFGVITETQPIIGAGNSITIGFGAQLESVEGLHALAPAADECSADINGDLQLNFFDISAFLASYSLQDPIADFNNDGEHNFFDISDFLSAFSAGCPCL